MTTRKILGIETSCDETSASVVLNGHKVLSNVISSQIKIHQKYGGVVPEIASRKHIENISDVVHKALLEANTTLTDIDAVAVTYGPGLVGALLVGISYAKGICLSLKKPLIAVNHIVGHICANYIDEDLTPPYICLVVSGGHTNLCLVNDYLSYEIVGKTLDDAAGESFDKVARALGLPYPGGPNIEKLAKQGDEMAIDFPKAFLNDKNNYNFSFSGVKSSVLDYINKCNMKKINYKKEDVAASFQKSIVDVLVYKTITLADKKNISTIALAGGVASNSYLREQFTLKCESSNISLIIPKPIYCTDNAAMIATAGYYQFIKNDFSDLTLNAIPNLSF